MGIALKADNVSIRYITGDFKDIGIKEYTVRKLTKNYHVKEFMAVDGVSFELETGDMLGIIGANGAGKSTLLKAVAGIMEPTRGKIIANGEVAALLELGSGFDGDLTVRENAYLRGAMLGYTQEFMDETYNQIIDFAELREFEDRPFKQLSSGMKSRLAFSIASLVNPDILILDEVLSVGDGAFQEKSAQKMRDIISQGATTILVSHSLEQIRELCNKVLWLDHGKQVAFGETQEICDQYERFLKGECPAEIPDTLEKAPSEPTAPVVTRPVGKRRSWARAMIAGFVLALFTGVISYTAVGNYQANHPPIQSIYITADDPATDIVTYRGAYVDGDWYSPWDTVVSNGNWTVNENEDTRTAVDTQPLEVRLRAGETWGVVFGSGPDKGRATVSTDYGSMEIDLFGETEMPLGNTYDISSLIDQSALQDHVFAKAVAAILTLFVFLIVVISTKLSTLYVQASTRDVWGDLLRGVCSFVIVLLHSTCNAGFVGQLPWLVINSFTAFAVPCFFMISGAYMLRREHGIKDTLTKRVPKSLIPLLFWSVIYILLSGNLDPNQFILMLFQEQTPHLWFMYCILAIYVLLPLLSKLYCRIDEKMKWYLLTLLLFFPSLLYTAECIMDRYVTMPRFAVFWPDLGLFFLGALLWDYREKFKGLWRRFAVLFLAGFAITTGLSQFATLRSGSLDKTFFPIGSVGNIMMAAGAICLFICLRERLQQLPTCVKRAIHFIGEAAFGVYLIHMLLLLSLNQANFPRFFLYANEGNLIQMTLSAVAYFLMCLLIAWSGRQSSVLRLLF